MLLQTKLSNCLKELPNDRLVHYAALISFLLVPRKIRFRIRPDLCNKPSVLPCFYREAPDR